MRPRDRLILPLAAVITLVWIASVVNVIVRQSPVSLEVFLPMQALEGLVGGYVFRWSTSRQEEA